MITKYEEHRENKKEIRIHLEITFVWICRKSDG